MSSYPCVTQGSIYTNLTRQPAVVLPGGNPACGDPYTMYGYWRRRFCSDYNYLTCYYYPYTDSRFYANGYINLRNGDCDNCD
jgi:hypothetical protein